MLLTHERNIMNYFNISNYKFENFVKIPDNQHLPDIKCNLVNRSIVDHFNINNYIFDDFVKIADIQCLPDLKWRLINRNNDYLYSNHTSWVYMIVVGNEIVKIGETGQPLGIQGQQPANRDQPVIGTHNRFGRLRGFGNATCNAKDTDCYIRYELKEEAIAGKVSLWAKKCKQKTINEVIGGYEHTINLSSHKELEQAYLNFLYKKTHRLPKLNKVFK